MACSFWERRKDQEKAPPPSQHTHTHSHARERASGAKPRRQRKRGRGDDDDDALPVINTLTPVCMSAHTHTHDPFPHPPPYIVIAPRDAASALGEAPRGSVDRVGTPRGNSRNGVWGDNSSSRQSPSLNADGLIQRGEKSPSP